MPDEIGDLRDERRVVTALFADIVGSTPLSERLDPEDLKLIVADAIARMIGAVEAFGGTVKDLAGDGLLALFGAPIAHEDDVERAIRTGLRIVDEIAQFAAEVERGWGVGGFGVRVGVDTGLVVVGAIGAGEPGGVRGARRRGEHRGPAAVPGRARAPSSSARRRTGSREPLFSWGEPVTLTLKGKAAPVAAHPVEAAAEGAPTVRGLEGVETPMVGRERELAIGRGGGGRRARRGPAASSSWSASRASGRPDSSPSSTTSSTRRPCRTPPPRGSRDAASPTASRCPTGRSATCSTPGSAPPPTSPSSGSA